MVIENGLYLVSDKYFDDFRSEYFCDNKQENRPNYCSFIDKDGIIWLIPLSSQIKIYRAKIEKDVARYGNCLFYHIGKIADIDRVFLIGNMFPISENYIKKPYTIANVHYIIKDEKLVKSLNVKAKRYIALVKYGKLKATVDIMAIKEILQSHTYSKLT